MRFRPDATTRKSEALARLVLDNRLAEAQAKAAEILKSKAEREAAIVKSRFGK